MARKSEDVNYVQCGYRTISYKIRRLSDDYFNVARKAVQTGGN